MLPDFFSGGSCFTPAPQAFNFLKVHSWFKHFFLMCCTQAGSSQSLTKCGHLGINAQAVLIRKVSAVSFSTKSMYKMPLFIILCKISKQKQRNIQASLRILSADSTLISWLVEVWRQFRVNLPAGSLNSGSLKKSCLLADLFLFLFMHKGSFERNLTADWFVLITI